MSIVIGVRTLLTSSCRDTSEPSAAAIAAKNP